MKYEISRCYIFPDGSVWSFGQFKMYLRHVRMSAICKCQCFCLSDIQKRSVFFLNTIFFVIEVFPSKRFSSVGIAMSLFWIFIHQNIHSTPIWKHITKYITVVFFSILLHQMCCVKHWKITCFVFIRFWRTVNLSVAFQLWIWRQLF